MKPNSCVVLVPFGGTIHPVCEQGLHALERRGYTVRRVQGFSAIDFGRCVLASEALADGFDELMWVDSDVGFDYRDVEKLRAHQLPFVCGIYPKKSSQAFACHFNPGTEKVVFGRDGGLHEIRYAGFGFVMTRLLYETMRTELQLPDCNQRFGKVIVRYFMPMAAPYAEGHWYLSEDYSFCERARLSGFKIMADTTIRLSHFGGYGYTWEDVGLAKPLYTTYTCNFGGTPQTTVEPQAENALP